MLAMNKTEQQLRNVTMADYYNWFKIHERRLERQKKANKK